MGIAPARTRTLLASLHKLQKGTLGWGLSSAAECLLRMHKAEVQSPPLQREEKGALSQTFDIHLGKMKLLLF